MKRRFAGISGGLVLLAASARADMLPPDMKAIETTIRVDGELPAGKALVLANTREGGDPVPLGVAVAFTEGRFGEKLELFLIDAAQVPRIDELRYSRAKEQIDAILGEQGCGAAFDGSRVTADDSAIVERRHVFNIVVANGVCRATMVRIEEIAKPNLAAALEAQEKELAAAQELTKAREEAKAQELADVKAREAVTILVGERKEGCAIGGAGGLWAVLWMLVRRRKR